MTPEQREEKRRADDARNAALSSLLRAGAVTTVGGVYQRR